MAGSYIGEVEKLAEKRRGTGEFNGIVTAKPFCDDLWERRGVFFISDTLIREKPEIVQIAVGSVLVLEATRVWEYKATRYHAISDFFDIVNEALQCPEYDAVFTDNHDGQIAVEWVKK